MGRKIGMKKIFSDIPEYRKDAATAVGSVVRCLLFVFVFAKYFAADTAPVAYPLEGPVENCNPYVQQFDALKKGQAHLDIEPDPKLAKLDNPYDPGQRSKVSYLWDRAYYDGKYYSNFGIAPVLTVYMPWYLLTGELPGTGSVMTVFLFLAAIFMPLTANISEKSAAP